MTDTATSPVILITGSARRLGAATVRLLHQRGCRLIVHYRRSAKHALVLQGELNGIRPDSIRLLQADLGDHKAVIRLAHEAIDCYGQLDGLVNNASAFYPTPLQSATESDWNALMDSNCKGAFFLSQQLAPALTSTHGSIVNITDMNADRGMREHCIYTMAKSALKSMTRSLARDLAPDVRVNAVAPGAILWPEAMSDPQQHASEHQAIISGIPAARLGDPLDIAHAVAYLLLDASYMTGQTVRVDGGRALC